MQSTKQPRKIRHIRASDTEWDDFKLVGLDAIRAWVKACAKKLRKPKTPGNST